MTFKALPSVPPAWRLGGFYVATLLFGIIALSAIWSLGSQFPGPVSLKKALVVGHEGSFSLVRALATVAIIIVVSHSLGRVAVWLRQPVVVGEMIAGIVFGPTVVGAIWPETSVWLFPPQMKQVLVTLSQIGIVLYMFIVGVKLDTRLLRHGNQSAIAISHAGIVLPFVLGTFVAFYLYQQTGVQRASFIDFAMFCGVAMSITAFPVLARMLHDQGLSSSRIGLMAIGCAAIDDVTAWCLLAVIIGFITADMSGAAWTAVLSLLYVLVMLGVIRPALRRAVDNFDNAFFTRTTLALLFVGVLVSSLTTELIGIHAIFGAFLMGVVVPAESRLAHEIQYRLEDCVAVLFLPMFFICSGMNVDLRLLGTAADWLALGLIIAAACTGKFGGVTLAARITGFGWRESIALGTLMNMRGLMELIVLSIGLELGILSTAVFSMFVIMALVTTGLAGPILAAMKIERPKGQHCERRFAPFGNGVNVRSDQQESILRS